MMPAWMIYTLITMVFWGVWGFESKLLVDRTSPYTGQLLYTAGLLAPAGIVLFSPKRFAGKRRGPPPTWLKNRENNALMSP